MITIIVKQNSENFIVTNNTAMYFREQGESIVIDTFTFGNDTPLGKYRSPQAIQTIMKALRKFAADEEPHMIFMPSDDQKSIKEFVEEAELIT